MVYKCWAQVTPNKHEDVLLKSRSRRAEERLRKQRPKQNVLHRPQSKSSRCAAKSHRTLGRHPCRDGVDSQQGQEKETREVHCSTRSTAGSRWCRTRENELPAARTAPLNIIRGSGTHRHLDAAGIEDWLERLCHNRVRRCFRRVCLVRHSPLAWRGSTSCEIDIESLAGSRV